MTLLHWRFPTVQGMTIKLNADKTKATIEVDLTSRLGPSASGKSINIATTGGNVDIGGGIKAGINIYVPAALA